MAGEKSRLSREDVCSIIEASAKAGIAELQFGDLHLKFGQKADAVRVEFPYPVQQSSASPDVKALTTDQHEKQTKAVLEQETLRSREDRLAWALVSDPELYEQLLRDGELTNDAVDGADEDDDE
jgi:hypothetical protein